MTLSTGRSTWRVESNCEHDISLHYNLHCHVEIVRPLTKQSSDSSKSLMARPYFRDWTNLSMYKGKTFLAPPRIFKHEHSLYFPNIYGKTVDPEHKEPRDTTSVLQGKASIVAIFSTGWGENQVMSFISKKKNPALHEALEKSPDVAQVVRINVEDTSRLKYWLIRMFAWNIRRLIDPSNWSRYFMVRAGITDEIRESIGYLNSKVGYVYLVDGDCKIRWAGSGPADPDEVESLAKGLGRLLWEKKNGVWEESHNKGRSSTLRAKKGT